MKTTDLLHQVKVYDTFLDEVHQRETQLLKGSEGFVKLTKNLNIQYDFISLKLNLCTRSASTPDERVSEKIYCKITFEIVGNKIVFKELYHENLSSKESLTQMILGSKELNNIPWQPGTGDFLYKNETTTNYLCLADEIASVSLNCTSGDSYRPGNYSEIQVTEDAIRLSQTNHMNSRSLDHKHDYSLRKLEITIPLKEEMLSHKFFDHRIGNMIVNFSDSSSEKNKHCGDLIREKINEVAKRFE